MITSWRQVIKIWKGPNVSLAWLWYLRWVLLTNARQAHMVLSKTWVLYIKYWKSPPRTLAISVRFNNLLVRDSLRHIWPHRLDVMFSNNAFQSHFEQFKCCLYSSEYHHAQRRGSSSPPPPALWNWERKLLFNPRAKHGLIRKHRGVYTHCWQTSKYLSLYSLHLTASKVSPALDISAPGALQTSVIPGRRSPLSPRLPQCNSDTQWQVLH